VDESLRRPQKGGVLGPVARIAFDATPFVDSIGGRLVLLAAPRRADDASVAPHAAACHFDSHPPPFPRHGRGGFTLDSPAARRYPPAPTPGCSSASKSLP
jgi:hypothetical protein